eukprot:snap_masked-scaffold_9-processed-gene-2.39-mRNA-1 protein AED:1.00 eAED:1.00 QI:0/0/0/0/1/1/2/0/338
MNWTSFKSARNVGGNIATKMSIQRVSSKVVGKGKFLVRNASSSFQSSQRSSKSRRESYLEDDFIPPDTETVKHRVKRSMKEHLGIRAASTLSREKNLIKECKLSEDLKLYSDEFEKFDNECYFISLKLIEFVQSVDWIYSHCAENNAEWRSLSRPGEGFPESVQYLWKEKPSSPAVLTSAAEYAQLSLVRLIDQIHNTEIFPEDDDAEFPEDFKVIAAKMFSTILRFDALSEKFKIKRDGKSVLNSTYTSCVKTFLYFGWYWSLLNEEEVEVLGEFASKIRNQYHQDLRRDLLSPRRVIRSPVDDSVKNNSLNSVVSKSGKRQSQGKMSDLEDLFNEV